MNALHNLILAAIDAHRLPGLDLGPGLLAPHYGGYSLANLPASVCQWLGAPQSFSSGPLAGGMLAALPGPYKRVVMIVMDGVGYSLFKDSLQDGPWSPFLGEAVFTPLTSIAPSTTAAALTTLWTGAAPGEHGTVGYELFLKEYGLIANMIQHAPATFTGAAGSLSHSGFDPLRFLPVKALGTHLRARDVQAVAFQPAGLINSGLSRMLLQDAEVIPYRSISDLEVTLREVLRARRNRRGYYYVYWSDVDTLAHRYGPEDERVRLELAAFSAQMARMTRALQAESRGDTLLILTADHGLAATPPDRHLELRHHPRLNEMLVMSPSGEVRLPFLFLREGQRAAAEQYIQKNWPARFKIMSAGQAAESGLFGPGSLHPRLKERLGDLILIPQGDHGRNYLYFQEKDNLLLGRHGGFSREEMLVPFFALTI